MNEVDKKRKRKRIIIGILVIVAVVSLFIPLSQRLNEEEVVEEQLTTDEAGTFFVTEVYPPAGEVKSIFAAQKIEITFNKLVNRETLNYTITPSVRSRLISEYEPSNTIEIIPLSGFNNGVTYTLTINKSLEALDGDQLLTEYKYQITRVEPQPGDAEYLVFDEDTTL